MRYKITIQSIEPSAEKSYPHTETIFEQQFGELDLQALARFLNAEKV